MLNLDRNINPTQQPISEYKDMGNHTVAHRYGICTTSIVAYDIWEPSALMGKHSTITTIDGKWYGSLPTRYLPQEIDALPAGSDERIAAVDAVHAELERQAETLVKAAFPQDFA